jgi:hypothetical protein
MRRRGDVWAEPASVRIQELSARVVDVHDIPLGMLPLDNVARLASVINPS